MFDEVILEYRAKRTTSEKIAFAFFVSLGLVCLTLLGIFLSFT
ncbi:MAG: hypothetical protein Q9M17_11135 [Mariprofundus sp.]|nr:hypothetical protein [Mariprofundus sp.]